MIMIANFKLHIFYHNKENAIHHINQKQTNKSQVQKTSKDKKQPGMVAQAYNPSESGG